MVNLSSFILAHARRNPDHVALIYDGERITYGEFAERIAVVGGWLEAQGVGVGDVVAALMKNSAAFLEIAFAVSHIGAVFLPINFRLAAEEVGYIVGNAGAKLIFADDALSAHAQGAARVVTVDERAQHDSSSLCSDASPAPMRVRKPDDIFRLMYTSGTTDRPKGVIHTYDNFYWKSIDQSSSSG